MPRNRIPLLPIIVLAAALRLFHLEAVSLWYDEIGQVLVSRASWWSAIAGAASHAGAAPLDYLLTHFMLNIGTSDGVLRLPAVLFGVGAVALAYLLGRSLFGEAQGIAAAFLLAIMPMNISYSQEVRFYSMATFFVLATVYLFWLAQERNTWRAWWIYGVVLMLGLYSHYYLAFVALGLGLWCLVFRRGVLLRFVPVSVMAALLFVPYAIYDNYIVARDPLSLASAELRVAGGLSKIAMGPFVVVPAPTNDLSYLPVDVWAVVIALWVLALIGLLCLPFLRQRTRLALPLFVCVAGLPGLLALDYLGSYNFTGRQTLLFGSMLLLAAIGTLFELLRRINRPSLLGGVTCAAIAICLYPQITTLYPTISVPSDDRALQQFLYREVGPSDVIVVGFPDQLAYYAPAIRPLMTRVNLRTIDSDMAALVATHDRVWIVPWLSTWTEALTDWSQANGAWNVSPFGRSIFVYSKDVAAGPALVTEMLESATLTGAQKGILVAKTGGLLLSAGRVDETVTLLEPYSDSEYATPALWTALGKAYIQKNDATSRSKAQGVYEKLVSVQPDNWEANYQLSNMAIRAANWSGARVYAEKGLASAPSKYGALALTKNLFKIYAQAGDPSLTCNLWQNSLVAATANTYLAKAMPSLKSWTRQAACD